MQYKIIIKDMRFYGFHGVKEHESRDGQPYLIDAVITADLEQAAKTDDYNNTICYDKAGKIIADVFFSHKFALIEALGNAICQKLLVEFVSIEAIKLTIRKPQAPVSVPVSCVAVVVESTRV